METQLTTVEQQQIERRRMAGQEADKRAAAGAFGRYLSDISDNTEHAQRADLATFSEYLCRTGATLCGEIPDDNIEARKLFARLGAKMQMDPDTWHGITWGIVDAFRQWMLRKGYAIASVNRKLSTVKMYAQLAVNAGAIKPQQGILIRNVRGHSRKASKNVDDDRSAAGIATRTSTKKRENVKLDKKHRRALKEQPDTPQGRRDAVIMALLLDHGLRVGELALLEVTAFDLKADTFTFYRPKVDKKQTHKLEKDSRKAIDRWFATDAPAMGPLLRSSRKGGKQKAADGRRVFGNGILGDAGMSERAITERVRELGEAIGIEGLSAHDCRHSWATQIARRMRKEKRVDPFALQGAGGWNSLAMPRRYIDEAAIANEGIEVDDSE